MKRTPLKRKTPLSRSTPVRRKRVTPRRVSVARDPDYLAWLRERKCGVCRFLHFIYRDRKCASGAGPIEAAHGPVNGRGSKGSDHEAIPLCSEHHREQHRIGWPAFEEKYRFSRAKEAAALHALYLIDRENRGVA